MQGSVLDASLGIKICSLVDKLGRTEEGTEGGTEGDAIVIRRPGQTQGGQ